MFKKYLSHCSKKEITTLIIVLAILVFDIFLSCRFFYYKNMSNTSSLDMSDDKFTDEIILQTGEDNIIINGSSK